MVFISFPSDLTEEELMLQAKYQKLKRKKKALQALKTPKPVEPEKTSKKLLSEAKDAKEVARKLIKSGMISAISKKQEKTGFKRSRGLERKLSAADKAPSGYQPFSATHTEVEGTEAPPRVKNLYDSFVSARDREERGLSDVRDGGRIEGKPRQGNTVYVFGYNITEDLLRNAFHRVGNIVNISTETEKNCGFVTFDKMETAEKAISEMNGHIFSGVKLKVSLARRQPVIEPINDATSSATWSTIAASHSQKGSHKDKRDMVAYDEDMF